MGSETFTLPLPAAPYRGIEPFRFIDQPIFSARSGEVRKLVRLITIYRGIFLYGESGVGKSSLINAGLIPALRDEGFAPERVRVQPFAGQELVVERIALTEEGAPPFLPSRFAAPLEDRAQGPARIVLSVEEFARHIEEQQPSEESDIAASPADTPVLIFDQFEELVTLFEEAVESRDKFNQARGMQNRIVGLLLKFLNDPTLALKLVFSFREDYLAKVSRCLADAPQLSEQAFRLSAPPETALGQIIRGPFENPAFPAGHFTRRLSQPACDALESAFKELSDSGTINLTEVQIACLALWESEKEEKAFLNQTDRREAVRGLFGNHLDAALNDLEPRFRKPAITALTYLVTSSGTRNIVSEEDLLGNLTRDEHLSESDARAVLQALARRTRLVLRQARGDSAFYEITSEFLVPWIREKRERQRADRLRAEQLLQKRKQLITASVACLLALTLIATLWGGYYFLFQEHETHYRDFGKRFGFPVGITRISKGEAQRLPVSFLLVHKGITREGWKLRWKPPYRMVAVNGSSEYTTQHGIGTYLWSEEEGEDAAAKESRQKAVSLRLHQVCQWEFVSDTQGNIAYEQGLDRSERMVWGLVYSPGRLDSGSTRRARFVGPDGFSQLQSGSAAEYVEIHYGKEGWEERVMFHDARNLPAIGPDGALGRKMTHDARGLCTGVLSLDANGHEMVDNVGNCGMLIAYDEKGRPIEYRSVGPDLNPMPVKDGYFLAKYQYDAFGRPQRLAYYGASGEPVLHKDGHHGWVAKYDERGNRIDEILIGLDGKPIVLAKGYASVRSTYDERGKVTRTTYHGASGEPVLHNDGNHGWMAEYDERGNPVAWSFIGLDGNPVASSDGYASARSTYDERGNVLRRTFFGASGEPVLHRDGNHGWIAEYDERGNVIVQTFIGLDGQPVALSENYASVRFTYDERGKVVRRTYFDASGEPVLHKDGDHGWSAEYDERGHQIAWTFIGLDGKPIASAEGYASGRSTYDERGRVIRTTYFGTSGEPVLHKDGNHGWSAEYDERGNQIAWTFIGLDGKPIALAEGYASIRSTYDERGKQTRRTYFGALGEPVLRKNGDHGWMAEYDERGHQIAWTFIGLDGKPIALADGYASGKSTYDERGNVIRTTYFGASGEPVLCKDGEHGWTAEYDDRGNQIAWTFIGLDGKPIASAEGYASRRSIYNERGRVIRATYFGASGEPVLNKEGHHGWMAEYDEHGKERARTLIGLDGKHLPEAP